MRKIFYFAAISAGLLLSSCSMNKDAGNTAYLHSNKLQAQQQLTGPQSRTHNDAVLDNRVTQPAFASVEQNQTPSDNAGVLTQKVQKHARHNAAGSILAKTGKTITAFAVPMVEHSIKSMARQQTHIAAYKHATHTEEGSYLLLWILSLVAAIVFFIIAAAALLSFNIGLAAVFSILGYLAGIAALVFFILWIVQLARG